MRGRRGALTPGFTLQPAATGITDNHFPDVWDLAQAKRPLMSFADRTAEAVFQAAFKTSLAARPSRPLSCPRPL